MVSIIVPVYNAEKYLDDCMQCLLAQTYHDIEIVLVNDGSKDRTGEICKNYADTDSRVKVINQTNMGVSAARNNGVRESKGEYITFVDGDDTVSIEMVEKLLETSERFSADFVFSGISIIDLAGNVEHGCNHDGTRIIEKQELLKEYFTNANTKLMLYGPVNKLIKRELAEKVSFDSELKIGEDLLYVYRTIIIAERIAECNDCLYNYIKRENSATTTSFNLNKLDYLIAAKRIVELSESISSELGNVSRQWYYSNTLDFCRLIASDSKVREQCTDDYKGYLRFLKEYKKEMWSGLNYKKRISYYILMYFPVGWVVLKKLGYRV